MVLFTICCSSEMALVDGSSLRLTCTFWDFSHTAGQLIVQWSRKHNLLCLKPPAPSWLFFFSCEDFIWGEGDEEGRRERMKGKHLTFQRTWTLKTTVILCMRGFTEPSVFLTTPLPVKGRALSSVLCSAMQRVGEHHLDGCCKEM